MTRASTSKGEHLGEVTRLLVAWSEGDLEALDAVFPLAFEDLRRMARKTWGRIPASEVQPTELIGEIYEILLKQRQVKWESRGQFYKFAAFLMERVLLGYKRSLGTKKRGGEATQVPIVEALDLAAAGDESSLSRGLPASPSGQPSRNARVAEAISTAVDIADKLAELAELDSQQADIVRLRYLIGLSIKETAETLGVSTKTVSRKWRNAKRFLALELDEYADK